MAEDSRVVCIINNGAAAKSSKADLQCIWCIAQWFDLPKFCETRSQTLRVLPLSLQWLELHHKFWGKYELPINYAASSKKLYKESIKLNLGKSTTYLEHKPNMIFLDLNICFEAASQDTWAVGRFQGLKQIIVNLGLMLVTWSISYL